MCTGGTGAGGVALIGEEAAPGRGGGALALGAGAGRGGWVKKGEGYNAKESMRSKW